MPGQVDRDKGLRRFAEAKSRDTLMRYADAYTVVKSGGRTGLGLPTSCVRLGIDLARRAEGRPIQEIVLGKVRDEDIDAFYFIGTVQEVQHRLDLLPEPPGT